MARWVTHDVDARRQKDTEARRDARDSLGSLGERLSRWGIAAEPLVEALKDHYARSLPAPDAPFVGPGLIHTEPWPEHFIMERAPDGFRLSGCVDLEECAIADSLGEIVEMYVSMLALEPQYLSAFRTGYERSFLFPPDAELRLRAAAADHDLLNILWLLDQMERRPEWSFATCWLAGHVCRLAGWVDGRKMMDRALFRKDIGPW